MLVRHYVDDLIIAGSGTLRSIADCIAAWFSFKNPSPVPVLFTCSKIRNQGKLLSILQPNACECIATLGTTADFNQFRPLRPQLAWVALTRPNILAAVNVMA